MLHNMFNNYRLIKIFKVLTLHSDLLEASISLTLLMEFREDTLYRSSVNMSAHAKHHKSSSTRLSSPVEQTLPYMVSTTALCRDKDSTLLQEVSLYSVCNHVSMHPSFLQIRQGRVQQAVTLCIIPHEP